MSQSSKIKRIHRLQVNVSSNDGLSIGRRSNNSLVMKLKRGFKCYVIAGSMSLLLMILYVSDVSYITSTLTQRVPVHRHVVRWVDHEKEIDHSKPRIMITNPGRMGNHMFEYSSLIGTSRRNNMTPIMSPTLDILEVFKLPCLQGERSLLRNPKLYYEEKVAKYNKVVEHLDPGRDALLMGYYQGWKYHIEIRDELLDKHFVFHDSIHHAAKKYIANVIEERNKHGATLVGIHVRRGDFVRQRVKGFTAAPVPYYYRAMDYFRKKYKNLLFIMATNDLIWAQEHLDIGEDIHYSHETDGALDLAILVYCHHVIITSGSFSWWAGYLSRGEVIYYNGYPRPNTKIGNQTVREDYYPPWWKAMD